MKKYFSEEHFMLKQMVKEFADKEIKPKAQTIIESAKNRNDKMKILLNREKWKAAGEWAKRKGLRFRIINEDSIYSIKK